MLSYRHSFHAGNFADVLKHLVLTRIITHMTVKETPVCYIDTHAGAGGYSLNSEHAIKTGEYLNGIAKLWHNPNLPELIQSYTNVVSQFNPESELCRYPGSPWIAQALLRQQDRLSLHEIHPSDLPTLKQTMKAVRRCHIADSDGFQGLIAQLPPPERRAIVLIDPPYEIKQDYERVVSTLIKAYRRFATGCYAIWYPVVERERITKMEEAIRSCGIRNVQLFELGLEADTIQRGMTSSGMIVINPPWKLKTEMEMTLPWLAQCLAPSCSTQYRIEQLVEE